MARTRKPPAAPSNARGDAKQVKQPVPVPGQFKAPAKRGTPKWLMQLRSSNAGRSRVPK